MSVIDPWPLNWKMPEKSRPAERGFCPFNKRMPMLCAAPKHTNKKIKKRACSTCYIRQLNITDNGNKFGLMFGTLDKPVRHVCDRCGMEIGMIDRIIYLSPEDRNGVALFNLELCYDCAVQLVNWANGEKFLLPDVDGDTAEFLFGSTLGHKRRKKRKIRKKKKKVRRQYKRRNPEHEKYKAEHPEEYDKDGNYIGSKRRRSNKGQREQT